MAQKSARATSVVLATGFWQTQSGPATTAPGNGKYNTDNWASPTLVAIAATDNNGYNRHSGLMELRPGDQITELATSDSQNYQVWTVTSVIDQGAWVQIGVRAIEAGSTFATPGMNQTRMLQALQVSSQEEPPGPTSGSLPSLATPDDIVARLGRQLNQTEAARVDAMLQDGSAIIRRRARNTFMYTASDTITVAASDGIIILPQRPIYNVMSVVARSGNPGVPDIPVTWFIFDGVDQVTIPEPRYSGVINLPEFWYSVAWYSHSYDTTYEHGYYEVPEDINGLLCNAIISELSTPTMSATLQSETIGAYSYSMRRSYGGSSSGGGASAGLYAALRDYGMDEILGDYRVKAGSIPVRRSLCIQHYQMARW